ncbi:MAG: hypothetical protein ACR2QC_02110 [Gammaproteobacteria bacterium]
MGRFFSLDFAGMTAAGGISGTDGRGNGTVGGGAADWRGIMIL